MNGNQNMNPAGGVGGSPAAGAASAFKGTRKLPGRPRANGFSGIVFSNSTPVRLYDPRFPKEEFQNVEPIPLAKNKNHKQPPVFDANHPFTQYALEHNLFSTNANKKAASREEKSGVNLTPYKRFQIHRSKHPEFHRFIRNTRVQLRELLLQQYLRTYMTRDFEQMRAAFPAKTDDEIEEYLESYYAKQAEEHTERDLPSYIESKLKDSVFAYNPSVAHQVGIEMALNTLPVVKKNYENYAAEASQSGGKRLKRKSHTKSRKTRKVYGNSRKRC